MVKTLKLTKDHLKLIPFFFINENGEGIDINVENRIFNLSNRVLEDMSLILGIKDKAIKYTENDADGRAFDDETTKYMLDVFNYVYDNLYYIETLIHQYVVNGGISEGTYKCIDSELIWEKED